MGIAVRLLGQKTLYQGWGRYLLLTVGLAGGETVQRQLDDHGGAAAVLPYDAGRRCALLARLPRAGPLFAGQDPHMLEACAGMIDPGESAEACARREAMEELGVRLEALEPVSRVWTSPGVSSERIDLYLAPYAAVDRIAAGGGLEEEQEGIEVIERPLAELWRATQTGELNDLKTLALIMALRHRRPDLFG
jgi:nudix-type nucleoside diphosphatase (YffH/AdpP family)